jgi:hypothetical protein
MTKRLSDDVNKLDSIPDTPVNYLLRLNADNAMKRAAVEEAVGNYDQALGLVSAAFSLYKQIGSKRSVSRCRLEINRLLETKIEGGEYTPEIIHWNDTVRLIEKYGAVKD